jgi:soluble lytic murein transglycosylase-like protein
MLHVLLLATLLPLTGTLDQVEQARAAGQHQQALDLLGQLQRQSPDLYKANNLLYLQAVLEEQAGLPDVARTHFGEILESDFPLPDNVLLHLIKLTDKDELDRRKGYFHAFLSRFPKHALWGPTAAQFADLLAENHQDQQAIIWRRRIVAQGGPLARESRLYLGKLLLKRGATTAANRRDALALLNRVLAENAVDAIALEAATELRRVEVFARLSERDLYRRALVFVSRRQPVVAQPYINQLIGGRFPSSPNLPEYRYLAGRSLLVAGKSQAAIKAYERAYRLFPRADWGVYSLLQVGSLKLARKDYEGAAQAFGAIVENNAGSAHFQTACVNLAETRILRGRRAAAAQGLRDAIKRPEAKGPLLPYRLALLRIEDQDYQEASESLGLISGLSSEELPPGVTREEVLFWLGFCLEKLNLADEAAKLRLDTVLGRPNYFAFLARERLPKERVLATLRSAAPGKKAWAPPGKQLAPRSPLPLSVERGANVGPKPETARLQELLFLRLYDEAYFELRRQKSTAFFQDEADYWYQLATLADRGGLFAESLNAAQRLENVLYGRSAADFYPVELQRLLYPLRYWDLVKQYGESRGIDPFLLLALIRQESVFQADAVSRASARGLMQIMPATGRQLARQLKVGFPGNDVLDDPEMSIRLGTYYFRQMLDGFGGSLEKALAAYNGGASNVKKWESRLTRDDAALFVSNIAFRETKLYVLRVLGYYRTYRSLYGAAPGTK